MPRKLLFFFALLLMIVVGTVVQFLPNTIFPIRTIICSVANQSCPPELLNSLQVLQGKSLFFTNIEQTISQLHSEFYQLETVRKQLPGTLTLTFATKKDLYILSVHDGTQRWIVSETGRAQQAPETSDLPQLSASEYWTQPLTDDTVDPNLHQLCLSLVTALQKNAITFQTITLQSPTEITVQLPDGKKALFSHENIDQQAQKLAIIEKSVDIPSIDTSIKIIDLRFKLPVLKTQ